MNSRIRVRHSMNLAHNEEHETLTVLAKTGSIDFRPIPPPPTVKGAGLNWLEFLTALGLAILATLILAIASRHLCVLAALPSWVGAWLLVDLIFGNYRSLRTTRTKADDYHEMVVTSIRTFLVLAMITALILASLTPSGRN